MESSIAFEPHAPCKDDADDHDDAADDHDDECIVSRQQLKWSWSEHGLETECLEADDDDDGDFEALANDPRLGSRSRQACFNSNLRLILTL